MSLTFNQLVQLRKATRGKRLKKPSKWLFPNNLERKYKRLLKSLVRELSLSIRDQLLPMIPQLLEEVTAFNPSNDSRNDDFLDRLRAAMITIADFIKPKTSETISEMEKLATEISEFNQAQFEKVNHSVFGIDIFIDQPFLRDQLEIFARQNSQLITSLPEQELLQISGIVERGLQEGQRFTDIARDLQERIGISERRANLIARDQTAKLNSSLTKLRQESVGIETFRWQTSGDERVRSSHKIMDGRVCRWDDPTVWLNESTGKFVKRSSTATKTLPGQEINCRCNGIAIIEGILD